MNNCDTHGRAWLKLSEAKAGQIVQLDSGFTCTKAGRVELLADSSNELYFECADGKHYIGGQADDGEHCIGMYPVSKK